MEMSGQHNFLVILLKGEEPWVSTEQWAGWTPESEVPTSNHDRAVTLPTST
jgi:hypothetical protein